MNIEQAKALKVGDSIEVMSGHWVTVTVGKQYPIIEIVCKSEFKGFIVNDDLGGELKVHLDIDKMRLVPEPPTPTQWIPFDKERMSEAGGYRYNGNREVTELHLFDNGGVAFMLGDEPVEGDKCGKRSALHATTYNIEMLVPVVVKYPCVCWVSDECKVPSEELGCSKVIINKLRASGWHEEDMSAWKYATPLTTAELAEIGLKQIS